jgi:signal transduction histidine kinase
MAGKYNVKVQYAGWIAVATVGTIIVLTTIDVARVMRVKTRQLEAQAQIVAKLVAGNVAPSLVANQRIEPLAAVTVNTLRDQGVVFLQVRGPDGTVLSQPAWSLKDTTGLLTADWTVATPVEGHTNEVCGIVRVGLFQDSIGQVVLATLGQDLVVGVLLLGLFLAGSLMVSAPVREALAELEEFVMRVDAGETPGEKLTSDLEEVNRVSLVLNRVVERVTEGRRSMERAQKDLKAAQKEMDEYTYVISHDLKEPLRGIEAFSAFLVEDYRDKLDDEGKHKIDVIRNSAVRMRRLIDDLLRFSRMSQQKNPMMLEGVNTILMRVRLNLQHSIDAKHVDLRVDKLPMVVCDATALTEVFHNLISNAIKYNENPKPVVEVGCAELPNPDTNLVEYVFHVRDNGPGIKKEYFDKVFQLFQRLHRDQEGTGIGLTIVKRVVEWHGGRIWLESEEGKGTTFYFSLPKRETTKHGTIIDGPAITPKGEQPVAPSI